MDENRSNSQIIGDISYQATDQLVIGGSAMYAKLSRDEMSVSRFGMGVGCTWDTDLAVVNAWVSDTNSGPCLYETGIFFKLSEGLRFGVEASKPSGIDTRMYYNLKYYEGPHRFLLGYDKMAEEWQIGYNLDI